MSITINKPNLGLSGLDYNNNPQMIILHHAEASSCSVYDINNWHKERGWVGIGYHYFVRKDGSIYRGRPENAVGAHCPGCNSISIGICAEGSYNKEYMPQAQKDAIEALIKDIYRRKGRRLQIFGHKEKYSTDCPGRNYPLQYFKNIFKTGGTSSSSSSNSSLTIAREYAGDNTLKIQKKLQSLGYDIGVSGADGDFGNCTFEAVKKFQSDHGLTVDGIPGPNTQNALFNTSGNPSSILGLQEAINAYFGVSIACDGIYGTITDSYVSRLIVEKSDKYLKINKWIQHMLNSRGYGNIAEDGYFGDNTRNAVIRYQSDHGLTVDGIVGPKTIKSLINK